MKTILFTVTTDPTYDQRMQRICGSLAKHDFQVILVGINLNFSADNFNSNFTQKRFKCLFSKGKLFYIEINLRLFLFLLFKKCDAICAIDLDTILPAFLVSKIRNKKLIYDAHEYFTESANLIDRKAEQRIWKGLERFIVPKLKYAYTVNQSIADLFKKEYGTIFSVVKNVPFYQKIEESEKQKNIIYQGTVRKDRGLDELIKAMQNIDAKLIIAGGGKFLSDLKQQAKEVGVEHKVQFTGFLSPDKLREITLQSYIGISPLEPKGFNHIYSLSNKFLEYIQLEIPQIAMNFSEYANINQKHQIALLINDVKAENFSSAINKLLQDESLYSVLKKNTKLAKEELCWEKEEKILIDFYHHLFA